MPGKTSRYSSTTNGEIKTALLETLLDAAEDDEPTVSWLQENSIYLANFTSQKLSRSLNELVELGLIKKGKLKSGRMYYRAIGERL